MAIEWRSGRLDIIRSKEVFLKERQEELHKESHEEMRYDPCKEAS